MFPKDSIFYGEKPEEEFFVTDALPYLGGFAAIYEVRDHKWNIFAAKTLKSFDDIEGRASIVHEGSVLEQVQCDGVTQLRYFHNGTVHDKLPPYLILEWGESTLSNEIGKKYGLGGKFNERELLSIFLQLAQGMLIISQKLVHHDIHSANILWIGDATVKIADFGVSTPIDLPQTDWQFRQHRYWPSVAPEYWEETNSTIEMDIYSMGMVFYDAATANYPYLVNREGDTKTAYKQAHTLQAPTDPCEFNKELNPSLSRIIMKMIEKDPAQRYHAWTEIIEELGILRGHA